MKGSVNHGKKLKIGIQNKMCLTPITLKKETWKQKLSDTYHMQQVPCGRCLECMKLRLDTWHLRLSNELKHSQTAYFVTYTYSDENVPYSENGLQNLNYKDHQDYMKRLRKRHNGPPIKYFTVGEYGETTHRPHYHSIIFNATLEHIEKAWKCGNIHIGDVSDASIRYTLKYALKRATRWNKRPDNDDDRNVEKALIARGLGDSYLTEAMIKYHKDDVTRPAKLLNNSLPLPRRYRDLIFTDSEKFARNKLLQPINTERFEKISSPFFPQRVDKMYRTAKENIEKTD